MDENDKYNFGGIGVDITKDPSIGNTNRFCTKEIWFFGYSFSGAEIIFLQKILQGFVGNKMTTGKVYKITDVISAKMIKKKEYMLSLIAHNIEEIAVFDKIYAAYWNGVIQAIIFKLPIFIFNS